MDSYLLALRRYLFALRREFLALLCKLLASDDTDLTVAGATRSRNCQ